VELDAASSGMPAVGTYVPTTEQSQDHVKPDAHRDFMSCFPTGIAVVTTVARDGTPRGLTCSSLSSVSLSPPILSVCMGVWSRTLAAVRDHGSFAVNILSVHGLAAAEIFASAAPGHFDRVQWRSADMADLPRLEDTAAFAACRVIATYEVGDHVVVFGEVTAVNCSADIPLLYGLRHFAAWPGDGFRLAVADPSVTCTDRKGNSR
jgi:flavin reductase (DIM6/NTAB) family NADH-FMN oxidoreductase RutF